MQSTPSPPRTLEPKWLRVTAGCAPKEPQSHFPTHHVSPLNVHSMLELLPGDPKHRLTPVPAAYAVNRDLYAWQIGMPPEACARESEAHERPYGASVRALEELAPCRRKQGRHRSFPSPSFSSCLAQIHSAEPSGNLGHLNALPSWPPSPGPCAPCVPPNLLYLLGSSHAQAHAAGARHTSLGVAYADPKTRAKTAPLDHGTRYAALSRQRRP